MKRIINPFPPDRNSCFGCSPRNPIGLKMQFYEEGEDICSRWQPRPDLQGWVNVLHGGIQATLLDEICSWVVLVRGRTAGLTSSMTIRYLKPLQVDRGELLIRARLISMEGREAKLEGEILNPRGEVCTEAEVSYFVVSEEVARRRYHYPGSEAFYERSQPEG